MANAIQRQSKEIAGSVEPESPQIAISRAGGLQRQEDSVGFLANWLEHRHSPVQDGMAAYERGDYTIAMRLWRPLADQGNAPAQSYLGGMYEHGRGVPQDDVRALMWVNMAAMGGDTNTARVRDIFLKHMTLAQIADAERLTGEWKPTSTRR